MADWKFDERVDYSTLVFRHIDRILLILSQDRINYGQLNSAVDGLEVITLVLLPEKKEADVSNGRNLKPEESYRLALSMIAEAMRLLEARDLLTEKVGVARIGGGGYN